MPAPHGQNILQDLWTLIIGVLPKVDLRKTQIYGEKWLRFSYENMLGRIGLWAMVKRAWFSKWYGSQMSSAEKSCKG